MSTLIARRTVLECALRRGEACGHFRLDERRTMAMTGHTIPEITVGRGPWQLNLRGVEAINAAGWTLKLLLFTKAVGILMFSAGVLYMLLKTPDTLSKWFPLTKWIG
jgi:hypothetical protein